MNVIEVSPYIFRNVQFNTTNSNMSDQAVSFDHIKRSNSLFVCYIYYTNILLSNAPHNYYYNVDVVNVFLIHIYQFTPSVKL